MADAKPQSPVDKAQRTAETAQWLALAAMVLILGQLAANLGAQSLAGLEALRGLEPGNGPHWAEQLNAVLRVWIWALPPILFVGALWHLRRALREYAAGRFFSPLSAHAVREAGESAVFAMIASIVIAPTLDAWTGDGAQRGVVWHFDAVDLAMLAFAVFVAAIGRVLDLAIAIKAENDKIV